LNSDLTPFFVTICLAVSKDDLYFTDYELHQRNLSHERGNFYSPPEVIIMRLLTVSRGYAANPATAATPYLNMKDAKKLSSRIPSRTYGFRES
jgi:hypothetical protein